MWKKLAIVAVFSTVSLNLASAQYADPYYGGYPFYGPGVVVVPEGFQSRPARLPDYPGTYVTPDAFPRSNPHWGGQQDEVGVDLRDRNSSPYAGGPG